MSDTKKNVFGVANAKVDVADINAIGSDNPKVIIRNKTTCVVTWNNSDEMQRHFTKRQRLAWNRKRICCLRCGH